MGCNTATKPTEWSDTRSQYILNGACREPMWYHPDQVLMILDNQPCIIYLYDNTLFLNDSSYFVVI